MIGGRWPVGEVAQARVVELRLPRAPLRQHEAPWLSRLLARKTRQTPGVEYDGTLPD